MLCTVDKKYEIEKFAENALQADTRYHPNGKVIKEILEVLEMLKDDIPQKVGANAYKE